jgi:hypothetical protein
LTSRKSLNKVKLFSKKLKKILFGLNKKNDDDLLNNFDLAGIDL